MHHVPPWASLSSTAEVFVNYSHHVWTKNIYFALQLNKYWSERNVGSVSLFSFAKQSLPPFVTNKYSWYMKGLVKKWYFSESLINCFHYTACFPCDFSPTGRSLIYCCGTSDKDLASSAYVNNFVFKGSDVRMDYSYPWHFKVSSVVWNSPVYIETAVTVVGAEGAA